MTDTQDLIARLRLGQTYDFESGNAINQSTVMDEAADALEASQAEIEAVKAEATAMLHEALNERDAALARLAELEKQEPVMVYDGRCIWDCGDGGHQDVTMLKMIAKGTKLFAAAGASPVEVKALQDQVVDLTDSRDFYKRRVDLLQQWQSKMRDPERTICCDIIANGQTLPPENAGNRYAAQPAQPSTTNGGMTGWPPGLLQDDCHALSRWLSSRPDAMYQLRKLYSEQPAQVPEGWQLVPVEPTEAMCRALFRNLIHADNEAYVIKAVMAAAPSTKEVGNV